MRKDGFKWVTNDGDISSADLVRECGRKLTDPLIWDIFQQRFRRMIFRYLLRSFRFRPGQPDARETINDLAQNVYLRLVRNNGRLLRSFKGTTDFSVLAFLARICMSVVIDFHRRQSSFGKTAEVISIDNWGNAEKLIDKSAEVAIGAILPWIDLERLIEADPDRLHAERNILIFKLHYCDGFTYAEIAQFPCFDIGESGVQSVGLAMMERLRRGIKKP